MISIIIADDHAMFRQGLIHLLQGVEDITILAECGDGQTALTLVNELRPDVAVLDVSMPQVDGLSAARRITQSKLSTRVVILTMHDDPSVYHQAALAGVHAFVLKDDAFEQLLATIRAVAASRRNIPLVTTSGDSRVSALTEREIQVLCLVARGLSNRAISEKFGISIKTVDSHRTNLMRKLDLHTTADLVRHAITIGII